MEGQGTFYYTSGNRYEGAWTNGKENGFGIFYWSNGDSWEGEWKDGLRDGKGTYYFASGEKRTGKWENDEFVEGSDIKACGCIEGDCENGYGIFVVLRNTL